VVYSFIWAPIFLLYPNLVYQLSNALASGIKVSLLLAVGTPWAPSFGISPKTVDLEMYFEGIKTHMGLYAVKALIRTLVKFKKQKLRLEYYFTANRDHEGCRLFTHISQLDHHPYESFKTWHVADLSATYLRLF
jgi:hypothetical protein